MIKYLMTMKKQKIMVKIKKILTNIKVHKSEAQEGGGSGVSPDK